MQEMAEEQQQEVEIENEQNDNQESDNQEASNEDQDDSVVVSIGEESPTSEEDAQPAPEWVKELRRNYRELQREKRQLEEQLKAKDAPKQELVLGQKPTLESCDYDAERFESELTNWHEKKRQIAQAENEKAEQAKAQEQEWQGKLDSYQKSKGDLKVKDFDDAEHIVTEMFSQTQQGIMLQGSENPALLVYALGKNPQKAKELASITDPVKYSFALAKLESQLKVTPKKAPPPERTIRGSGPISGSVDSTLEALRAEAEKTGDYTKVVQYRRNKRSK